MEVSSHLFWLYRGAVFFLRGVFVRAFPSEAAVERGVVLPFGRRLLAFWPGHLAQRRLQERSKAPVNTVTRGFMPTLGRLYPAVVYQ